MHSDRTNPPTEGSSRGVPPHCELAVSRRDFLRRAGGGFGALALSQLLWRDQALGGDALSSGDVPLSPKGGHHPATAKHVIFIFLQGGPSHIDLFDPKPALQRMAGKPLPPSFKPVITAMGEFHSPVLPSTRVFKQHGRSGLWISDWLPHIATVADEISVIRSCWADGLNHVGSVCQMNTGSVLAGRPSLGAWANYGLGSLNDNLPTFMVLLDRKANVHGGPRNWGAGFMPATYQGTQMQNGEEPIENLNRPKGIDPRRQRRKLDYLNRLNRRFAEPRSHQTELEARIASYELAFRMQAEAPGAVDLSDEPAHIRALYGLDEKPTADMGRSCLLARRMVERGVRFVQVYSGAGNRWDAHSNIEKNHTELCQESDQPVAALITDLKQRGLLDDTLVVWGGEFGRTPMSEKGDGRDHNPTGFTMWMAGGGVVPGQTIGTTDEAGLYAVDDRVHVRDLHATILHAMGLDAMRLTFFHNGRLENPVMNTGVPVHRVFGA